MDLGDLKYLDAPAKVLKLSEAIRIGAKKRPQCTGYLFDAGASCALGAAYEGLGYTPIEGTFDTPGYYKQYNVLCQLFDTDVCRRVESMNDDKGLTREAIADVLEAEGS